MPVDRSTIDAQLRDIGEGDRWWEQREFRDLPYILNPDERILGLVDGKVLGQRRPRILPGSLWLIVATDQRLICLKRERVGRQQMDVYLAQVSGFRHRTRLRTVQLTLDTPQRRYRIRIAKQDAFRFVGALAPLVSRPGPTGGEPVPAWLPGATGGLPGLARLVSSVVNPPPPADFATRGQVARLEATVERLESEVERLQQHLEFLESLLEKRADGALSLPARSADP